MLSSFLSLLSVFFFVYFPQHGLVVSMPLLPTNKVITAASATKRDREIANLVALKAGKDINKQLYWHYRGYLINVNTGKPIASIEGLERVSPIQNFPMTISPIGRYGKGNGTISGNATDFKLGYITDKTFVYTECGKYLYFFPVSMSLKSFNP